MTVRKRPTKKGFSWEFCITIQKNPRKQYRKGGFKTKAEAKEAEEQAILLHNTGKLNTNTILFRNLVNLYIENAENKYSLSTIKDYKNVLNNHFQELYHLKAKDVTTQIIQKWLDSKENNTSVWVIQKIRKLGKAIFNYGIKKEIITFNPFVRTDSIETPHIIHNRLEINEAVILLNKCIELYPEATGIIALGLFSGLRRGEILGLKWSDIDFKKCTLNIQRQYTKYGISEYLKTKSSRRKILVCQTMMDILLWHKKQMNVLNEYVFWNNGKIFSLKKLRTIFKKLLAICKLPDMRFHDTRGTFVDLSLSAGIPMKLIQQSVGHAKITTTADIYTEILQSVKNKAAILFEKNLNECEHIVNI